MEKLSDMRVFACMASSLDGKIGPANVNQFVPIGSRHDMQNLISLRDEADGILFGASTFRTWPKVHQGNNPDQHAHHFIMSRRLDLDFNAELFQHPEIPVTILSGAAGITPPQPPPGHVEIIPIPDGPGQIDRILEHIARCGIKSLMVEGGGHVLHAFIEAQVLDELFLTLVPTVIGDVNAPALLGRQNLSNPPQLSIRNSRLIGNETFLQIDFKYT